MKETVVEVKDVSINSICHPKNMTVSKNIL